MTSSIHEQPGFIHGTNGLVARWQDVTVHDFDVYYVAGALANINRYVGRSLTADGCPLHISVARHSITLVRELEARGIKDPAVLLAGLFHDASEAFVGDLQSYVKQELRAAGCTAFDDMEAFFTALVCEGFDVPDHREFPIIKEIDVALCKHEREYLYGDQYSSTYAPSGECFTPEQDFGEFIAVYKKLIDL